MELGSGMGNIKEVIPDCITTDLFPNAWLDRVENAYALSDATGSLSNIILFDVFHHLRHPCTALQEFHRVLVPGGRVVMLEPGFGALGRLIYEKFHHEPCGFDLEIEWLAPSGFDPCTDQYYAAQGNAWRFAKEFQALDVKGFRVVIDHPMSAVSYVASGGFRGPQLYPDFLHPAMRMADTLLSTFPALFATRLLMVLEKNGQSEPSRSSTV
jgi:SAM-dependent methyltransferase